MDVQTQNGVTFRSKMSVPRQKLGTINKHHPSQGRQRQETRMAGIMGDRQQTTRTKVQRDASKPSQQ